RLLPRETFAEPAFLAHLARAGMMPRNGGWGWRFDPATHGARRPVDAWPLLAQITAPTLVVRGALSPVLPAAMAERLGAAIPRAAADGRGHVAVTGELTAPRLDAHAGAAVDAQPPRVARMDRHLQPRRQLEQALHAAREGAAVPVVEQAAGVQHERIVGVGQLGRLLDLARRHEAPPPAGEGLGVEIARARMPGRRARPLDATLAIEP